MATEESLKGHFYINMEKTLLKDSFKCFPLWTYRVQYIV